MEELTLEDFEAVERSRRRDDPVVSLLMQFGEALADAGMIDAVGGSEWRTEHDPELSDGTFRRDGAFGRLAEKIARRLE